MIINKFPSLFTFYIAFLLIFNIQLVSSAADRHDDIVLDFSDEAETRRLREYLYIKYIKSSAQSIDNYNFINARKYCQMAICLLPDEPDAYITLGTVNSYEGKTKLAIRCFNKAEALLSKEKFPGLPADSDDKIGLVFPDQDQYDAVKESLYRTYMKTSTQYIENLYFTEAKEYCEVAIYLLSDKPDAYMNLGIISISESNLKLAVAYLKKAEDLLANDYYLNSIVFYNLGLSYYKMGDYGKAAEYFARAAELNNKDDEVTCALSKSYEKIGKEEDFLCGSKAPDLFKQNKETSCSKKADKGLGCVKGDFQKDSSSLAKRLLENGSNCFKSGEYDQAVALIKESILIDSACAEAYYRLGVIYAYKDDLHKAKDYFSKTIEIDPFFTKAYTNLGSVYGKFKEYGKALKYFKQALELDKSNPNIYYNIGMVHIAMGKEKEAKFYLDKAEALSRQESSPISLD
ncbi:MAG: tetratricopeptide repeat protein [Candidatus Omnitrophota bacterium]